MSSEKSLTTCTTEQRRYAIAARDAAAALARRNDAFARATAAGHSLREIADATGLTQTTVARALARR